MAAQCDDDVVLSSTMLKQETRGKSGILLFWGLLHETYPDAMIKPLKKRLRTVLRKDMTQKQPAVQASSITSTSELNEDSDNIQSSSDDQEQPVADAMGDETDEKPLVSKPSISDPKERSECSVQYIFKFTGTRIINKTVGDMFNDIVKTGLLDEPFHRENVANKITRYLTNSSSLHTHSSDPNSLASTAKEYLCNYIIEAVLTLNYENKITHWFYDILSHDIH